MARWIQGAVLAVSMTTASTAMTQTIIGAGPTTVTANGVRWERRGFANYGVSDGASDIVYAGGAATWSLPVPALPAGCVPDRVRVALVADDHYGQPLDRYGIQVDLEGNREFDGAAPALCVAHGAPFAGRFSNWSFVDFPTTGVGANLDVGIRFVNLGGLSGGDWYAIDYFELLCAGASPAPSGGSDCPRDPLSVGLSAHYPLDGDATDTSGNQHNGVVVNASATTDRFGRPSGAMRFDGAANTIRVAGFPSLGTYTLAGWINWDSVAGWRPFLDSQTSVRFESLDQRLALSDHFSSQLGTISAGTWHHMAVVYDPSVNRMSFYFDCAPAGSATPGPESGFTVDRPFGGGTVYIGEGPTGGYEVLRGSIDDVRIYDRALPPSEVLLFCGAPSCSGVVCPDDGNPCTVEACETSTGRCASRAGNAGAVCRPAAGVCDVAESCDGTSAVCPADAKSTALCRAEAGACDVAESCDGRSNDCPADAKSTAVCRGAAGVCDVPDSCDGRSNDCPADAKSTAECRGAAGVCDVAESCDGRSNDCPADAKSTAECRGAAGVCDVADSCDGRSNDCPADAKSTAECRGAAGVCDVPESCDGRSNDCPADAKSTAVCRPSASACDAAESCNGSSNDCPADGFFSTDPVIWRQPLARNGMSEDTGVGGIRYAVRYGSTIPVKTRALSCNASHGATDVTSDPNVTGTVMVFADGNCDGMADGSAEPIAYNGVGGAGGMMVVTDGQLQYNLDTKALPLLQCYVVEVLLRNVATGETSAEQVLLQRR